MLLNVPLVPDPGLAAFVGRNAGAIHSCHIGLHSPLADDCRHRTAFVEAGELAAFLAAVPVARKYVLLNSRAHAAGAYLDPARVEALAGLLDGLVRDGGITGVVFADAYLLRALSDVAPDTAGRLEAVPSVNCQLDSWDRLASMVDFVVSTRFRLPAVLILDRSLNRRLGRLEAVSARVRAELPGTLVELLANEGCLDLCPFKPAHDCLISMRNAGMGADTHRLNRELGCLRELRDAPWRLFKSPFIRPEDMAAYVPYADVLKVCGRTLGPGFIERAVGAYLSGRSPDNLLDLLDALEPMARRLHVAAAAMPDDFLGRLAGCLGDCRACGWCRGLYGNVASPTAIGPDPRPR